MLQLNRRSALVLALITSFALLAGAIFFYSQLKSASVPAVQSNAAQGELPGGNFTLEGAAALQALL